MSTTPTQAAERLRLNSRWPSLHPTTQAAFNEILWKGGLPRIEIARALGVSRTRLTAITRDLDDAGLIVEGGREQRSSTGRPAEMLYARTDRYHFLGVHVRLGSVIGVVVDLANRAVWERQIDLPDLDVDAVFDQACQWFVEASAEGLTVAAIAVCAPIPESGSAVRSLDVAIFRSGDGRRRVEAACGIPVWIEEDIVALTAFEQWPQLAGGQESMALISLGSEISFGLVADLKIIVGAHQSAGRFGHVPVATEGPVCPLGHRGCLWSTSSTGAIAAAVPGAATVQEVASAARDGDARAAAALDTAARGLGAGAGHVVNLLDPDKLVLTGESHTVLSDRLHLFHEGLRTVQITDAPVEVSVASIDFVEWARAAGAYASYRTLSGSSSQA
ncbi:MAG TPA: ROK family transcriptional regulator [Demequina sp.]|nr:ROK family transcriptional regulator [Demequina sp.]